MLLDSLGAVGGWMKALRAEFKVNFLENRSIDFVQNLRVNCLRYILSEQHTEIQVAAARFVNGSLFVVSVCPFWSPLVRLVGG